MIKNFHYIKSMPSYFFYIIFSNLRFTRPIFLIFILDNHISLFEFSILQVVYFSSRIISNIPSGILGDIFRSKHIISIGLMLSSLSFFLLFITPYLDFNNNFYYFILVFTLDGAGSAFCSGVDQAMVYEYLKEKRMEDQYVKIFGFKEALIAISMGLSALIGGIMASSFLGIPFLLQSLFGILAIISIMKFKDLSRKKVSLKEESMILKLKNGYSAVKDLPYLQFLIVFMAIIASSTNSVIMFTQSRFSELNIENSTIGTIYLISTILSVIVSLNINLIMRFKISTIIFIVMSMFVIGGILLTTEYIYFAVFGYFLIYITIDVLEPPLFFTINKLIEENIRATVLSFFSTILSIVSLIMYLLYGYTGDMGGFQNLIKLMIIIHIPLFIIILFFYRKEIITSGE